MSDHVEEQDQKPEGEKGNSHSVDDLMARMERLESSNSRLLDESKQWKSKYQSLKGDVEEREAQKLHESNDFKGLYERAQQKIAELQDENRAEKQGLLRTTLKYEVAKHAKDAHDVEDVINALGSKKGQFAYDKESKSWQGIDTALEELRSEKYWLFEKDKVSMETGRPSKDVPKEKSIDELIEENPMAILQEAFKEML